MIRHHVRELLEGHEVNQRQIDHDRGFVAGMELLLRNPERALRTFETAVRKAITLEEAARDERS